LQKMGGEDGTTLTSRPLPKQKHKKATNGATLVRCRYYSVGCLNLIRNQDYEQHLKEAQQEHIDLLEHAVLEQAEQINYLLEQERSCLVRLKRLAQKFGSIELCTMRQRGGEVYENIKRWALPDLNQASGVKCWQLLYVSICFFVCLCYIFLAALSFSYEKGRRKRLSILQLLPMTVYMIFMTFHWYHARFLSRAANTLLAVSFVLFWMLLNVFLLPVF